MQGSCACTARYTAFNGQEFDVIIAGSGYEDEIRVTKVG
jgi:hypothetical protein